MTGRSHGGGPDGPAGGAHDAERGLADVKALGGLSEEDFRLLDSRPSDPVRRQMLTSWFGYHGSCVAWRAYHKRQVIPVDD